MLKELIVSMRPKQWTKNVFLFAALVFDLKLFNPALLGKTIAAFALFCLLSSTVYLINDLADIERDRLHPTKRNRPLPAGRLPLSWAMYAAIILLAISLPLSFYLDRTFGLIALSYLLLQVAYSFSLKDVVILDVMTVAAGFVLRVAAGAVVAQAERFSPWLYVCTTLLALFIALGRRREELILLEDNANQHRKILEEYSPAFIDEMLTVVTAATIIAYSLYTFSAENLPANKSMMLTIPFVIYGLLRYLYLIHQKNMGGSPEEIVLKDIPLLVSNLLWGLTVVIILYLS
jgi:4-hydroxybenzoate polyprenyltransferase